MSLKTPPSWQGVESARLLAEFAHLGQTDLQGLDYYHAHVSMVVAVLPDQPGYQVLDDAAKDLAEQAAWLHDTFEDTRLSLSGAAALGMPNQVAATVLTLTKGAHEPRPDYIARILRAGGPVLAVKQADNTVNFERSMALPDTHPDKARLVGKYGSEMKVLFATGGGA